MDRMCRGVNMRLTSFLRRVCRGGSWLIIISRVPSSTGPMNAPPVYDENVSGSRSTAMTSSHRVSAQKPGTPSSAWSTQATGCSRRRKSKYAWGGPERKVAPSARSTSAMRIRANLPTNRAQLESVLVSVSPTTRGARMPELLDLSTKHCRVERDGHVVILTMDRPEARTALSPDMLVGLADGFDYVDREPEVRVAILTGAAGHFSSGADLKAMAKPSDSEHVRSRLAEEPNLHWKALLRDYRLSKPLVAAVEGYAVAGGTEMLQGTDLRVAADTATFGVWEAKRALFPLGGSAVRLPRQIPYARAMDILLTCRPIPAYEALDLGWTSRVVPEGHALAGARVVADQVAANGPLACQAILRAWREAEGLPDFEAMQIQDKIG